MVKKMVSNGWNNLIIIGNYISFGSFWANVSLESQDFFKIMRRHPQ